jgi:hypothetical protein
MFPSFLPLWHSGELTGRVDLLVICKYLYSTGRERKNFLDLAQILGPTLAWERSADAPDLA